MLASNNIQSELTETEKIILNDAVDKNRQYKEGIEDVFGADAYNYERATKFNNLNELKNDIELRYYYYVTEPNGSTVGAQVNDEMDSLQIWMLDTRFTNQFPNATLSASSSNKYNCHSYTWYQQSSYNPYWLPDPSYYMTDGSYTSRTMSVI